MTYLLDTDLLIYMIRGLKATARQSAHRQRAMSLVDRCRKAVRKTLAPFELFDYDAVACPVH
jgi:hypothetical protein